MTKLILLFIFCLLIKLVFGTTSTIKAENKVKNQNGLNAFAAVNSTGIELYNKYYLVDRYGYYLRWDGRKSPDNFRFGLTSDLHDGSINNDWYLFLIEPYGVTKNISIKNIATGRYISHDYSSYFYLMSTNSSGYPINLSLLSRGNSLYSIQSAHPNYPYFVSYTGGFMKSSNVSYISAVSSSTNSYTAYISFIRAVTLNAKLSSFKYAAISNFQNYITKVNVISPSYLNNTSTLKIQEAIQVRQSFEEYFLLYINQDTKFFDKVEADNSVKSLFNRNNPISSFGSKTLSSFEQLQSIYTNLREYSIERSIEIPPNTKVKLEAYFDQITDFKITFEAVAEITGSDSIGILPGSEIYAILQSYQNYKFTITQILSTSVKVKITGYVIATFGLNNKFVITNV